MPTLRKITYSILLLVGLMVAMGSNFPEKIPNDILTALKTGNAKLLSTYFNKNVDLVVMENDNVYSKAQAQQIVSNFFNSFNPAREQAFSVIHDGGKTDSKYVIGKYKSSKGEFRVYFLLKKNSNKEYIHQLRIEKQ